MAHLLDMTATSGATAQFEKFRKGAELTTGLIFYPIISIVGIVCNTLCIVIFNRKLMRSTSTNHYLTALAVSDLGKLANDFVYFPTTVLKERYTNLLYATYYPYGYFFSQYFACVTSWMTVAVAFERFLMVVYPVCSRRLINVRKARATCFLIYALVLLVNIPCALRYKTICRQLASNSGAEALGVNSTGNIFCSSNSTLDVDISLLWNNFPFRLVYIVIHSSIRSLIPLILLIVLSARIIGAIHQTRANKRLVSRHRITVMLIVVIVFCILLSTPDAIMSLMGWGYHEAESNLRKGIREITDTLLALNSAVNFFLYVSFNKKFRDHLTFFFHCSSPPSVDNVNCVLQKNSKDAGNFNLLLIDGPKDSKQNSGYNHLEIEQLNNHTSVIHSAPLLAVIDTERS